MFALVLLVLATVHVIWIAVLVLLPAGVAWIGVLSTLNAAIQTRLPGWVRARGLAVYLLVFQGGQAVAAPVWGALVQWLGLTTALLIGTVVMLLSALTLYRWKLYSMEGIDPSLSDHWPTPAPGLRARPSDGPVLVSVVYRVAPDDCAAFIDAMDRVAHSRRRTGALTWGLFQDGNDAGRFIENYLVGSWAEHLAQHHNRLTATDRGFEDRVRALLLPGVEPEVTHAFDATVGPVVPRTETPSS